MLREKSEIMGKAVDTLYGYSGDEKVRYLIQARQQALFDEKNALSTAKKEGRAEGEAKGRAEGEAKGRAEATAAFVKNLKAMGMSEEEIRKALSFSDSKADDEIEDEDDEDYEPEM